MNLATKPRGEGRRREIGAIPLSRFRAGTLCAGNTKEKKGEKASNTRTLLHAASNRTFEEGRKIFEAKFLRAPPKHPSMLRPVATSAKFKLVVNFDIPCLS